MIGQRFFVIMRESSGRAEFWRNRRGRPDSSGWTFDLAEARAYRRPDDAARAARQVYDEPLVEVVEIEAVVSRVHYRVTQQSVLTEK